MGLQRIPIRAVGKPSVKISSYLATRSVRSVDSPVIFPPGRACHVPDTDGVSVDSEHDGGSFWSPVVQALHTSKTTPR